MPFEVEYTDEFGDWWGTLSEHEQDDVAATIELLADKGPMLPFPYSSGIVRVQDTATCDNCEYSMPENLVECCMQLIRGEP